MLTPIHRKKFIKSVTTKKNFFTATFLRAQNISVNNDIDITHRAMLMTNIQFQFIVTPTGSPKGSYKRSISEDQAPRDTITLSAVNNQTCSCGAIGRKKDGGLKSSSTSPEDEIFQHAPTSCCSRATDRE